MTDRPFSPARFVEERRLDENTHHEAVRSRRHVANVAAVLCSLALAPAAASHATAQRVERVSAQLALARICASEIGLTGTPEECAAIHDVLSRRAQRWGTSFTWAARAYSRRVFDPERRDPRAWIAHLRPDGRRPRGWPDRVTIRRDGETRVVPHAPWSRVYRERWLALYEAAGRIRRGEIPSPCRGPVDHWGMRHGVDFERAQRAGWTEVDCGETRNAFWAVPERGQG